MTREGATTTVLLTDLWTIPASSLGLRDRVVSRSRKSFRAEKKQNTVTRNAETRKRRISARAFEDGFHHSHHSHRQAGEPARTHTYIYTPRPDNRALRVFGEESDVEHTRLHGQTFPDEDGRLRLVRPLHMSLLP